MKRLSECRAGDEVLLLGWHGGNKPVSVPVVKVGRTLLHVNVAANAGRTRVEKFRIDTGMLNGANIGVPPRVRTEDEQAEAERRGEVTRRLFEMGATITAAHSIPLWRLEAALSALVDNPKDDEGTQIYPGDRVLDLYEGTYGRVAEVTGPEHVRVDWESGQQWDHTHGSTVVVVTNRGK